MDSSIAITNHQDTNTVEREASSCHSPQLGQWYWVLSDKLSYVNELEDRLSEDGKTYQWLGCVTKLGSNYVELSHPSADNSCSTERVLLTKVATLLQLESCPDKVIKSNIQIFQSKSINLMGEIKHITSRLGVTQQMGIGDATSNSSSTALTVLNQSNQVDTYKTELIKAKEVTLPTLFDELKKTNSHVAKWMKAESLTYSCQLGTLQETIGRIDSRIFNVSLYAGLGEYCELVKDGEPAPFHSKLHVMQRKLFMDEECLLDYDAGGMAFNDIGQFDAWLSRDTNFTRIFGYERCLVAFQVRRDKKARYSNDLHTSFINFRLEKADELTFLYVRNGDKLYRVGAELEFEDMLFPSSDVMFNEPMMAKYSFNRVEHLMPVREYEAIKAEYEQTNGRFNEWARENPNEHEFGNPFRSRCFDLRGTLHKYEVVNDDYLYFDEVNEYISKRIEQYNRIVLIIQGLLDRSDVLHPHPVIKLHKPDDFHQTVKLIYDAERVLTYGQAPDFETYRQECNSLINHASVLVGQESLWFERDREIDSKHRFRSEGYEQGPGKLARAERIQPKAKKAVFTWLKEKADWSGGYVRKTITVPFDALLNVSAYQKGDYKRFYQDPRTRRHYLQWAPYLLAAEDYVNGKEKPKLPNTYHDYSEK